MTVGELIDRLEYVDRSLRVTVSAEYDCGYGAAGGELTDIDIYSDSVSLNSEG